MKPSIQERCMTFFFTRTLFIFIYKLLSYSIYMELDASKLKKKSFNKLRYVISM
jgi:hypothetical protein